MPINQTNDRHAYDAKNMFCTAIEHTRYALGPPPPLWPTESLGHNRVALPRTSWSIENILNNPYLTFNQIQHSCDYANNSLSYYISEKIYQLTNVWEHVIHLNERVGGSGASLYIQNVNAMLALLALCPLVHNWQSFFSCLGWMVAPISHGLHCTSVRIVLAEGEYCCLKTGPVSTEEDDSLSSTYVRTLWSLSESRSNDDLWEGAGWQGKVLLASEGATCTLTACSYWLVDSVSLPGSSTDCAENVIVGVSMDSLTRGTAFTIGAYVSSRMFTCELLKRWGWRMQVIMSKASKTFKLFHRDPN